MKSLRPLTIALLTAGVCFSAGADDGAINNKSMSGPINDVYIPLVDFENNAVEHAVLEAEHAFTGMMNFYVPSQSSNGEVVPIEYEDADGNLKETLEVAKPLVNVFVYGPAFEVEGTAFAHSYMDIFGAVSFDDGVTFKRTNLSESANLSSFNLAEHDADDGEPDKIAHTVPLTSDWGATYDHAVGLKFPYTSANHCVECHGSALQGTLSAPSCFRCHDDDYNDGDHFQEDIPENFESLVFYSYDHETELEYPLFKDGHIIGKGINADDVPVAIVNGATGENVGFAETLSNEDTGLFDYDIALPAESAPPCSIAAAGGADGQSPAIAVLDEDGNKLPQNSCAGTVDAELDLGDYPGGAYNVFHAVAGNRVLAAWPSRYCEKGQPTYAIAYDGDDTDLDTDQLAKRTALEDLLGIDVESDLYLTDLFGVAGSQGSIDFADENYPQAGIVPFGCVWTARGFVLPGDDPRTEGITESSYMVWTKAERLTSGRRDPNRIEVMGVEGAGFVITWQEDPDGIRPGQGLGPGEGWSGAVAHSKTDIWYSYIPWENFDLVEATDDPAGEPLNVAEATLLTDVNGRPQVYVPMAVPMRLSNNDKCNADLYGPDGSISETDAKYFNYCNYDVAADYGFQNFCSATETIPQGNNDEEGDICVNDDGLPNIANTAATRPRLALKGYDSDGDDLTDSAWVIVAAEESKGLGRFGFLPTGETCDPETSTDPDCVADEGKNQWYYSFDMGDYASSATMEEEYGLVQNLVSQGNMLNQPEVDWRTGEFYPEMSTEDMWDFETDFVLYNTEIARRASMLAQSIGKAVASQSGLLVTPSWKQGAMRQGGPADTMLRRITAPVGYGGYGCPVVDDPNGLTITSASWDSQEKQLHVVGEGADGDETTKVFVRNAMTEELVGSKKEADEEDLDPYPTDFDFYLNINTKQASVPCAIQAADEVKDGEEVYGPWILVTDAPDDCELPVPDVCTIDGGSTIASGIELNPYAFTNMICDEWMYEDGSNPYYPDGLCMAPATNLSGTIPDTCSDDGDGDGLCPTVDFDGSTYGIGDTNPILQGYTQGEGDTTRVLTWHQCPSDGEAQDDSAIDGGYIGCDDDDRDDIFAETYTDQSWYNPLEVSKGHRGFIDGDFVMFLYAWSPNWRLNAKGNDRYELYIRRSFDGGETWGVMPASFTASDGNSYSGDGTVTCESYRTPAGVVSTDEPKVCFDFDAGALEHARNVTQHKSMRITTLDPRYSPSRASILTTCLDNLGLEETGDWSCDDESDLQDTDVRNPSRYFIAYETGDNTTVKVGEAEPLDLFYGRGENFGDDYTVWTETDTDSANPDECYPTFDYGILDSDDPRLDSGFCNEFDRFTTGSDAHASEASLTSNPDGSKLYGVWTQGYENEEEDHDAQARRVWWLDDFIPEDSYTLPGLNGTTP